MGRINDILRQGWHIELGKLFGSGIGLIVWLFSPRLQGDNGLEIEDIKLTLWISETGPITVMHLTDTTTENLIDG
jgi:hypothetical protein